MAGGPSAPRGGGSVGGIRCVMRWPLAAGVGVGRDVGDDAIHCQIATHQPALTVTGREGLTGNPDNHATYVALD